MAGEMDDLFKAMSMFSESAKGLALQRAITGANDQVSQIRSSELKEEQKRAELENVSRNLVARMAGIGAPATTIQQVAGAIGPKQYANADQMMMEGVLSGNQGLVAQGQGLERAQNAGKLDLMGAQARISEASQKRLFEHQTMLEMLRQQREHKTKQQQGDVEFNTNVDVAMTEAKRLKALIKKSGNFEMLDADAAAKLDSASYQLAINYAKIVDPASVAREGEVAAAQKYLIPIGLTTRNSKSLAAIDEYVRRINEYRGARAKAKQHPGTVAPAPEQAPSTAPDWSAFLKK